MRYDAWLIAKLHHEEMNKRAEMYPLLAEAEATAPPGRVFPRRLRAVGGHPPDHSWRAPGQLL